MHAFHCAAALSRLAAASTAFRTSSYTSKRSVAAARWRDVVVHDELPDSAKCTNLLWGLRAARRAAILENFCPIRRNGGAASLSTNDCTFLGRVPRLGCGECGSSSSHRAPLYRVLRGAAPRYVCARCVLVSAELRIRVT